jgi:hypothetical protein
MLNDPTHDYLPIEDEAFLNVILENIFWGIFMFYCQIQIQVRHVEGETDERDKAKKVSGGTGDQTAVLQWCSR